MLRVWIQLLVAYRHAGLALVLMAWLLAGFWTFSSPRPLAIMEAGGASQSEAARVQYALRDYFGLKIENSMALVLDAGAELPAEVIGQLEDLPLFDRLQEIPGQSAHRNRVYYLQFDVSKAVFEVEALVPVVRQIMRDWEAKSGVRSWLTGQQPFFYDMAQASQQDTASAERWGLLLAFVVLVFCFGSLSAALLPLLVGASTLLWTQVLLQWLQIGSNQTSLVLNSMLGLGLTIDYSLFVVSRYREERQQHGMIEALEQVLRRTGRTLTYSAVVMLAALVILLIPEVEALRGTVKNLVLVVVIALLNAVICLPVLLLSLDGWLNWPRGLSQRILGWHNELRWRRLALHVTRYPWRYFLLSLSLLLLLAWPLKSIYLWEPLQSVAPRSSPSVQGFEVLAADGWGGEILPVQLLIYAPEGQSVLDIETLQPMYELITQLEKHPEVDWVQGLVSGREPLAYYQSLLQQLQLLGDLLGPELPLLRQTPAGEVTLINIYQRDALNIHQSYRLLEWLRSWQAEHPEIRVEIGGIVARAQSFTYEMYRHLPLMFGLILASITLLLALWLRSVVLPLKAGLMNFLPIMSAFGILVWAFQWGWLQAHDGIVNIVPMVLFCIVFGLSMDYEVLILSRIDEAWQQHGDVREAVVHGLARSSGIITGAALILLGVFSVGATSSSPVVQQICLGISATILLDATLVRLLLVPAFMMLMGKWNWWHPWAARPGNPPSEN